MLPAQETTNAEQHIQVPKEITQRPLVCVCVKIFQLTVTGHFIGNTYSLAHLCNNSIIIQHNEWNNVWSLGCFTLTDNFPELSPIFDNCFVLTVLFLQLCSLLLPSEWLISAQFFCGWQISSIRPKREFQKCWTCLLVCNQRTAVWHLGWPMWHTAEKFSMPECFVFSCLVWRHLDPSPWWHAGTWMMIGPGANS